ncbi:MAG: DNA-binding response regulator [Chloroflexi bacterium]|nr:MAG: DNA-binding response regulator [Chloroflexota bacterium]
MANEIILIIDDEELLQESISLVLQKAGYRSASVNSGTEGLAFLQENYADLVLLDLKLEDENGLDFIQPIQSLVPGIPILILTANASLDSAIESVRKGARDYIPKPFKPSELIERVEAVLCEVQKEKRRQDIIVNIQELVSELDPGVIPNNEELSKGSGALPRENILTTGFIRVDLDTKAVLIRGERVKLSPTAFQYLVVLMRSWPNPVPVIDLVHEAQGYEVNINEARDLARWRIHEIRKSLASEGIDDSIIQTIRGLGYSLVM